MRRGTARERATSGAGSTSWKSWSRSIHDLMEHSRRTFLGSLAIAMAEHTVGSPNYHVIDPHVHVWKHNPAFPFADVARVPEREATPEMLLGLMKANGVQRTVIIQVIHYRYDNRYLASVLKQYPRYFKGVARVDPLDPVVSENSNRMAGNVR